MDENSATDRACTLRLQVSSRREIARDIIELELGPCHDGVLPPWQPGAHVSLILKPGLERPYSLCGSLADSGRWRIAVLRDHAGRGGSAWIHDNLRPGHTLDVRPPLNHFALEDAEAYTFIAGGIGITPFLPMIELLATADKPWILHYGGRSAESMAYTAQFAAYGSRVHLYPEDQAGLLPVAEILAGRPRSGLVYCCGPEALLAAVQAQCPATEFHFERFSADSGGPRETDVAFEVELQRSGVLAVVPPGRSILGIAIEAGASPLYSCAEGTCGTCETVVLAGIPDHRDTVLSSAERASSNLMMICVSRALSRRLILDL